MGNEFSKVEPLLNKKIEPFITKSRKYRHKLRPLCCSTKFEVFNGFRGMLRDVTIHLCSVISRRVGLSRNTKDQCIRAMIGIDRNQIAWKAHSNFIKIRIRHTWFAPNPSIDLAIARTLTGVFDQLRSESRLLPPSAVDYLVLMIEMLGSYGTDVQPGEAPTLLLRCLFSISYMCIREWSYEAHQKIRTMHLFPLLRFFLVTTRCLYYKQMGYITLASFYKTEGWMISGEILSTADIVAFTEIVASFAVRCPSALSHYESGLDSVTKQDTNDIVAAGLRSPFSSSSSTSVDVIDGVRSVLSYVCKTMSLPQQREFGKDMAKAIVSAVPFLGVEYVPSHLAWLAPRMIEHGLIHVMEDRLEDNPRVESGGRDYTHILTYLCESCGQIAGNAIFSSKIVPSLFRRLQHQTTVQCIRVSPTTATCSWSSLITTSNVLALLDVLLKLYPPSSSSSSSSTSVEKNSVGLPQSAVEMFISVDARKILESLSEVLKKLNSNTWQGRSLGRIKELLLRIP